jgi:hypothetical protein
MPPAEKEWAIKLMSLDISSDEYFERFANNQEHFRTLIAKHVKANKLPRGKRFDPLRNYAAFSDSF